MVKVKGSKKGLIGKRRKKEERKKKKKRRNKNSPRLWRVEMLKRPLLQSKKR